MKKLAKRKNNLPKSLYVHIPFCRSLCPFCDFVRLIGCYRYVEDYLTTLFEELGSLQITKHSLDTIYIGGGTPTSIDDASLRKLLSRLKPLLKRRGEFTIETNPENLTLSTINILKEFGINRLSIGVQTFSPFLIADLNRHHSFESLLKFIILLRKKKFKNINLDFIYCLPKQSDEDLLKDISLALCLNPDHMSFYSLIVEEGSVFYRKGYKEANQDDARFELDLVERVLSSNGYKRYEISNFAKSKRRQSLHNKTYWKDDTYYAVGLGASGYIDNVRYKNCSSLSLYLAHKFRSFEEKVTASDDKKYFLLCNLRLVAGFSLREYKRRFQENFVVKYGNRCTKYIKSGALIIRHGKVRLSSQGLAILDTILLDLFD